MALTRRSFVKGATILPFAVWLAEEGWAQPMPVMTRWDARSAQGIANLKIYASAVTKMRNAALFPEKNPRSWTFQWYTHQVKGNIQQNVQNKANAIQQIYGAPASVWKSLALDMWNTCQAHLGQPENYFLPWHRMYVLYIEQIVRKVTAQPSFTLPYWNYSVTGPDHGVIPPQFRMPNDATFGSLYVSKRNAGVNNGTPIDQNSPPGSNPLSLDALKQCKYGFTSNAVQGFNQTLDFGLHGNVHVLTGNSQNMGSVPWAAYDPIFYLHHCNIDRLWASWNADPNRKNPNDAAFTSKTFVFANGDGNKVTPSIGSVLNIATLGYKYDHLEPLTPAHCPATPALAAATVKVVASKVPRIPLGPGPVRASLEAPAGASTASVPLGTRIERLNPEHHLYLVVNDLKTEGTPGVVYHLYLELPPHSGSAAGQYYVGSINFFAAEHRHEGQPISVSFDITDLAKKLKAQGHLAAKAELTIAPAGTPASEAKPTVGEVALHEA
ncbi:MAG TPA: tyrosinase family protein [Thermoanaerobaculia bacterium]|nr:tyrosinase family protein [Thermoanaerobaculia bacterium]